NREFSQLNRKSSPDEVFGTHRARTIAKARLAGMREIAFFKHRMNALVAIHDLRDPQVDSETAERVRLIAVEPRARADDIEHLAQRDHDKVVEIGTER